MSEIETKVVMDDIKVDKSGQIASCLRVDKVIVVSENEKVKGIAIAGCGVRKKELIEAIAKDMIEVRCCDKAGNPIDVFEKAMRYEEMFKAIKDVEDFYPRITNDEPWYAPKHVAHRNKFSNRPRR